MRASLEKESRRATPLVGIVLPHFESLLGRELFPNYRLGTELAGYAKAFGFGGIIHSDEDSKKYVFTDDQISNARKKLGAKKGDAFILLLGDKEKIKKFFSVVLIPRLKQLLNGIPGEVRKANPDGTTRFLRPMPGAARMYPETDIPRVIVNEKSVTVPKLLKEQEADLVKKFKITESHAKELLREGWAFDSFVKSYPNLQPSFLATTLLDTPKELKKRFNKEIDLLEKEAELELILEKVNEGAIPKDAVIELLALAAENKKLNFDKYKAVDEGEIERVVKEVIAADPKAPVNALMGQAMAKLRGKAPGQKVMELLRKHAK
jgi:glutamyl-tRNA(Gln) amidotransferase subunit E